MAIRIWDVPPVLAAASVGIVGGVLVRWLAGARDDHGAPIYRGAFVGMTLSALLASAWWIAGGAVLAGLMWSISREAWVGIGGKIGTVAVTAVLAVLALAHAAGLTTLRVAPLPAARAEVAILIAAVLASRQRTGWRTGPVEGPSSRRRSRRRAAPSSSRPFPTSSVGVPPRSPPPGLRRASSA